MNFQRHLVSFVSFIGFVVQCTGDLALVTYYGAAARLVDWYRRGRAAIRIDPDSESFGMEDAVLVTVVLVIPLGSFMAAVIFGGLSPFLLGFFSIPAVALRILWDKKLQPCLAARLGW